jgi:hypothetical protein
LPGPAVKEGGNRFFLYFFTGIAIIRWRCTAFKIILMDKRVGKFSVETCRDPVKVRFMIKGCGETMPME